jgi:hypothetical protein
LDHIGYPQDAVDELIAQAVAKGERDDITAVLMELPPEIDTPAGEPPYAAAAATAANSHAGPSKIATTTTVLLTILTVVALFAIYWLAR